MDNITIGPYRMKVIPDTHLGTVLAQNGTNYERHVVEWLRGRLRPGDSFLDVGACWGYYALVANWLTGGDVRTVSVEPNLRNLGVLVDNLVSNRIEHAVVLSLAAGSRADELRYPGGWENVSGMVLPGTTGATVSVAALGLLLPDFNPAVIKLDVEGSELAAISGMMAMVQGCRSMVMEFCPEHIRAQGLEPAEVFRSVAELGWRRIVNLNEQQLILSSRELESTVICDLAFERELG